MGKLYSKALQEPSFGGGYVIPINEPLTFVAIEILIRMGVTSFVSYQLFLIATSFVPNFFRSIFG